LRATTPVYSKSGEYFGLIIININMNYVFNKISNLFDSNFQLYMTNNNGDYIIHPDKSKAFGFDIGRRFQMQHEFKAIKSFFAPDAPEKLTLKTADAKGENLAYLAKYHYDQSNPSNFLAVAAFSPITSLFAQGYNARTQIILATAFLALIGAILAVSYSIYMLRPLSTLSKATELLASGASLDTIEVPIEQSNLVGSLSRCFIRMATTLKEKETSIKAILSTASNPIITIDSAGVIHEANDATTQLFGYSREELVGANVTVMMTDEIRERHTHYFGQYQERSKSETSGTARQVVAQHKNGTIVPIHIAVGEISLHNQRMFTAIITDLTELKKLDKMKDEFVSTVSHELRTPLTSIKGALGLLDSPVLGELPEQAKSMIRIAHNNSDRLVRLINDILDIEKIEAGKMNFTLKEVELLPFLARVVDANRAYALQFMVMIELSLIDENSKIIGDPDRLEQVVTNLLSNAVKYSPKGGRVFVTAEGRANTVRISIRDEGSGIPEEFQKKIFSKFAQADSSDTRAHSGTGLGLAISKAIVEHHGGTIGFNTTENNGTTFYFDLPLTKAKTEDAPTAIVLSA
ncbi:MAG: ATP-binding protein, partial [Alphaproteobacteria bacterium]